ncbi:vWA domain-containing protein [Maritalea porphyrae]|jgi:Ca-activated chloride channel family protein|uniref:vWA domain-containing protein n=1 Tax=Maritalea porphyrae TaxID=880732 RepID=UPI0022AF93A6|nr:vWA domain-containing protein [Maritalea porphyrae]MCZ4273109.1 VWA domain-containing protein [Maritalea porphyrae]
MKMTMKALVGTALVAGALSLSGCGGAPIETTEAAHENIAKLVAEDIKPTRQENRVRANIELTPTNLLSLLPSISEYPITVGQPDSSSVESVEIFTSSEKSGKGTDGLYNELAERFNRMGKSISNGKTAAISVRKMPSGLGAQFILAGQNVPDAFSPSNKLWGKMIESQGISVDEINPVTAPNTAGIVVRKSKIDLITTDGVLDLQKLLTEVTSGEFSMGYTNPYQSSTGLNFLMMVLHSFAQGDEAEFLSPDVASAFEAFQLGVPFVAQNTLQMRDAAVGSGVLDALVMENQTWVNVTGMADYEFVPFGVRHDSPLYALPQADEAEREVLDLFNKFIIENKGQISDFGFGGNPTYKSSYDITDGSLIQQAQKLWKDKKSGGKPIAAVFVADVSGSMDGSRIKELQKALVDSSDLIAASNAIGLVSYNNAVNIDLPVRQFNLQQKSLFIGAVESLSAGGATATNDAVVVAANELINFGAANPDHKLIIFVLSDGETNEGLDFSTVKETLRFARIPIHTIAYELSSDHLKEMASLVEAAYIESSVGSASYRIGNLLNSEM